jgi:RNA polymerase sigma-70 factor (ECF subfamily)
LLDAVVNLVRREYEAQGQAALFEQLKFCLTGERSALPYAELASRLAMPEATVKTKVHRLRQRYRALLRAEVANTVATPGEIEEELRHLLRVLAS